MHSGTTDIEVNWGSIVDNLHESIITTDADGFITRWNKGAERLFGYTAEEVVGLHVEVCHERSREALEREIVEPLKRNRHYELFGKMVRKSGETFDGHMLASVISGPDGTVTGMAGYIIDITDQRRAESELAVQTNLLKRAEEYAHVGHFHRPFASDQIYWSDGMYRIFGVDRETFLLTRETAFSLLHPDDFEHYAEQVEAAITTGGSYETEVRVVRPDGEIRHLHAQGGVELSDTGEPVAIFGVVKDITEAKLADSELKESNTRYRDLYDNAPFAYATVNPDDGSIRDCNQALAALLGYSRDELTRMAVLQLYADTADGLPKAKGILGQLKKGAPVTNAELQMKRKGGQIIWVNLSVSQKKDESGKPIESRSIIVDITDRKASEEALKEEKRRAEQARLLLDDAVESFSAGFALYDADDRFVLCNGAYLSDLTMVEEYLQPGVPFEDFLRAIYGTKAMVSASYNDEHIIQKRLAVHKNPEAGPWQMEMADGRWLLIHEYHTHDGGTALIRSDITDRKMAENQLRESEERFRDYASATSDWFWEVGIDGIVKYLSQGFKKFSGQDPEGFIGKKFFDVAKFFKVEAETADWRSFIDRIGRTEPIPDLVFSFVDADGDTRFMQSSGIPVIDQVSGKPVAYRGTSKDVTDQKVAERALAESEERFDLAMQGANDGLWDRNMNTGEFYYSPRWYEMLGYESSDLPNTNQAWETLMHPDDHLVANQFVTDCLEGGDRNYEVEFRMRHKDGHYLDILGRGFAVRDDDGNPIRLVGTNTDISARKQAEAQLVAAKSLAESGERIRSAFENIAVGNVVMSDQGIIEIFNSAARKMFGYTAEEVIGQNVKMLMPEPDRNQHDGYIRNYLETGETNIIGQGRDVIGLRKNGEEFPLHLDVGQIASGSEITFIGSMIDLTNTKQLEEQVRRSQRLEAVGQLTGGVAHDFNNLLAIMIGNTELLGDLVGDDPKAKKRVQAIQEAVDRGSSLTQRLLAFSRRQTLSPAAKDVSDLIGGLEDMLRRTLGETVDLRIDDVPDLWLATIDPHQFENALINLAINARDAMPDGGVLTIEVANVTLDETYVAQLEDVALGDYVKVAVSDDGAGMLPEVLEKVFEPFFTTKDVGEGSGLGLSMVYGFVKQSEGHVTIYSEIDKGTTINLYLPRSQELVNAQDAADKQQQFARGSERILVVEDDAGVREVAVSLLKDQGYEIVEAQNGEMAIASLNDGPAFDLLFTDVVLPGGMNGVEIAERARRIQPNIKVLFTTGYAENAVVHNGHLEVGTTLVNKPYRRVELLEKVRGRLDSQQA